MNYKKIFHNELGAAAVEFAVVLLPLLTLVMGAIEFGTIFYNKHILTNASREAARAAIVQDPRPTISAIRNVATTYLVPGGNSLLISYKNPKPTLQQPVVEMAPIPTPEAYTAGSCTQFQERLRVTISYPYDYLFLKSFLSSPVTLTGTTVMYCE